MNAAINRQIFATDDTIAGFAGSWKNVKTVIASKKRFPGEIPFQAFNLVESDQVEAALVGEALAEGIDQAARCCDFRIHEVLRPDCCVVPCILDMYLEIR
jgi:hypothetical protein